MVAGRKVFLLVFNFASLLLFSGTVFGWTALSQILKREGFYADRCDGAPPCRAQEAALDAAFTLASTAYGVSSLPGGLLLDKAGPLVTIIVGGAIGVLSIAGMAAMKWTFHDLHVDLFPVFFVGVAVGGALIRFCGYSVGFLFPGKGPLLIALASVLFDGSCLVYPVLQVLYDAGVKFQPLFAGYAALGVVVFILLPAAWYLNMGEMNRVRDEAKARQRLACSGDAGLESRPIMKQMQSLEFVAIFCFSIIQLTHSNLFIGSVTHINQEIAQKRELSSGYLSTIGTIVSFVIPMGFLAVPAITASIRRFGNIGTLQVTNFLGMILNGLQLVPVLWLQVLTVILFATFRAFLFSNVPQFNAHYFGVLNMGRIQGICFLSGGIVNLVQVPMINYSLINLKGEFAPLLVVCIAMTAVPLVPCTWLQLRERRRHREALLATGLHDAAAARTPSADSVGGSPARDVRREASLHSLAAGMHGSSTALQASAMIHVGSMASFGSAGWHSAQSEGHASGQLGDSEHLDSQLS